MKFREVDDKGEHAGGPMFAIKNGLGKQWHWLGHRLRDLRRLAGFGIGNMVQANGIASVKINAFGVDTRITGIVPRGATGAVVLGGIRAHRRGGRVAGALHACIGYILSGRGALRVP